jgi:hypothetical protein
MRKRATTRHAGVLGIVIDEIGRIPVQTEYLRITGVSSRPSHEIGNRPASRPDGVRSRVVLLEPILVAASDYTLITGSSDVGCCAQG